MNENQQKKWFERKKEYSENFPIKRIIDLLNYKLKNNQNQNKKNEKKNENNKKNNKNNKEKKRKYKLLLCHDMRGNYLNDRFINGSICNNNFEVIDWSIIDIFCYFSHDFIVIPPDTWINTCKKHNVQIIGTFITEWEQGFQICQELFSTPELAKQTAEALILIAIDYQLNGWLINIENPLPTPNLVENITLFLSTLTNGMHLYFGDDSIILWYDSVTIEGKLNWQDGLTSLNKQFFDNCDGIFINYTWKEASLSNTLQILNGNERESDIYYGIDVFGRGSIGNGGYNCCDAIQYLINNEKRKFSIALFAPGWVLETQIDEPKPQSELELELDNLKEDNLKEDKLLSIEFIQRRYNMTNSVLRTKYNFFWKCIKNAWCNLNNPSNLFYPIEYQISSNPPIDFEVFSITFSSSFGLYLFHNGECYPHWPTTDTNYEKLYQKVYQIDQNNNNNNILPCIPYYNLTLQDMKWIIINDNDNKIDNNTDSNNNNETNQIVNNKSFFIEWIDEIGWNGTGSIRFYASSSNTSRISTSKLEIPLFYSIYNNNSNHDKDGRDDDHNNNLLQLRFIPFSQSSILTIELNYEIITVSESKLTFKVNYVLNLNDLIQVYLIYNDIQSSIIEITFSLKILKKVNSCPKYCWWSDNSNFNGLFIENLKYSQSYWNEITFQILSFNEIISQLQLNDPNLLVSDISQINLVNAQLYFNPNHHHHHHHHQQQQQQNDDNNSDQNLELILGSFDIFSSSRILFLPLSNNNKININNFEVNNIIVDENCDYIDRAFVKIQWDEVLISLDSEFNPNFLPINIISIYSINNYELITIIFNSLSIDQLDCIFSSKYIELNSLLNNNNNHNHSNILIQDINNSNILIGITSNNFYLLNVVREVLLDYEILFQLLEVKNENWNEIYKKKKFLILQIQPFDSYLSYINSFNFPLVFVNIS